MRLIDEIIIHCSATRPKQDIGADWIRNLHVNQNGWTDIGYHYVIRRNGDVEKGRPVMQIGSHCKGHNNFTIGICLVGGLNDDGKPEDNFTLLQWTSLFALVAKLEEQYPIEKISGHNQYSDKACPCFNVPEKFANR